MNSMMHFDTLIAIFVASAMGLSSCQPLVSTQIELLDLHARQRKGVRSLGSFTRKAFSGDISRGTDALDSDGAVNRVYKSLTRYYDSVFGHTGRPCAVLVSNVGSAWGDEDAYALRIIETVLLLKYQLHVVVRKGLPAMTMRMLNKVATEREIRISEKNIQLHLVSNIDDDTIAAICTKR